MNIRPAKMRTWSEEEREHIRAKIEALRPWHYMFDFGEGFTTRQGQPPLGKFEKVLKWLPDDLQGASCLDCPSNNAQLAMLLKDRGAGACVARDISKVAIQQAEYLVDLLGYDIDVRLRSVYDITQDPACADGFDYVFCLGLIYHLTDMCGAIELLSQLTKSICFIETEVLRVDEYDSETALFIEDRYASDRTNWWIPGVKCVIGMARAAGFPTVECVDYWEHSTKVSREGYRMQARGIFRASKSESLPAPRFVVSK